MRKYTEEFIDKAGVLKNAIVGFELEFYVKDLSFYKTMEVLNKELYPIQLYGFRDYHPTMKPTNDKFLMTPDLSGGSNMVEIVTGPMPYYEGKFYLVKLLKFINECGYTNDKCSIHFNLSFNNKVLSDLNVLKLILDLDEEEIYKIYPSRRNNVYAKSIKRVIPYKEYDYDTISIDILKNNLRLPEDKYYGINFLHLNNDKEEQRLEFRYIGGKDYEKNIGDIIYFLDKFIITVNDCFDKRFTNKEINNLHNYLEKNILNFKNFSNYDNFLTQFPTITLQIDQNSDYDFVNAYYSRIYNTIYNLVEGIENLSDCILNWVTSMQKLEIVDAKIKGIINLQDFDFINCEVEGIFYNCQIINSRILNSQLIKCIVNNSEIRKCKLINCTVDNCDMYDSFFMNGYFNGSMNGGILRSGKLGPYANISSTTKVINNGDNFFNTKFGEDEKSKGKGLKYFDK